MPWCVVSTGAGVAAVVLIVLLLDVGALPPEPALPLPLPLLLVPVLLLPLGHTALAIAALPKHAAWLLLLQQNTGPAPVPAVQGPQSGRAVSPFPQIWVRESAANR